MSNFNQTKMKTQNMNLKKVVASMMMVATLLIISSCGSNQERSSSNKEEAQASEVTVKTPNMDIHTATLLGDLDAIKQHIAAGSNLDEGEPTLGSTPLISAAVFGKTEIARALIEAGADVNIKNNEGSTALHSAAFLCRMEIVEMLLANGVDKEQLNNYGSTALQSVSAPFADVMFIYDQFSKDLGPLGFKLDYEYVEATRPKIAELLQ
jgi:ankyrin repeat protein